MNRQGNEPRKRELPLHCKILFCFNIILFYYINIFIAYLSFITIISCFMLHNMTVLVVGDHFFIISKMSKTSCFKCGHFINIYISLISDGYVQRTGIEHRLVKKCGTCNWSYPAFIFSAMVEKKQFIRLAFSVFFTR